tara:strand:- start:748 stop:1830 length:1083 start_codon:yes stop_codon:yes gene_type:complete
MSETYTPLEGHLHSDEILQLAMDAGFSFEEAVTATGIALAESNGNPNTWTKNDSGGAYGLWQISGVNKQWLIDNKPYINSVEDLYDPVNNAKAAFSVAMEESFGKNRTTPNWEYFDGYKTMNTFNKYAYGGTSNNWESEEGNIILPTASQEGKNAGARYSEMLREKHGLSGYEGRLDPETVDLDNVLDPSNVGDMTVEEIKDKYNLGLHARIGRSAEAFIDNSKGYVRPVVGRVEPQFAEEWIKNLESKGETKLANTLRRANLSDGNTIMFDYPYGPEWAERNAHRFGIKLWDGAKEIGSMLSDGLEYDMKLLKSDPVGLRKLIVSWLMEDSVSERLKEMTPESLPERAGPSRRGGVVDE